MQHVITKIGVHSRAEAAAFAYANGIVEPANESSQPSWDFDGLTEPRL